MFESIFSSLFKYERLVFEQGQFVLGATRSMWLVAGAAAVAALYVIWSYSQVASLGARDKGVLLATRTALLLVAMFAILRPMLLLKVAVPQQNFVGILLDDSRSMGVADEQGRPRSAFVQEQLGRADAPLLAALTKRFVPRVFRFSSTAERLQSSADLTFQGTATRLGDAIDRARDELGGLPVAGLVVVTDGADNAEATLDETIAGLKAQGLPVFSVGVGKDNLSHDVQVTRVQTPRRVLKGAALVVDVVVAQTGYAGMKVPLVVEDEGRMVSTQEITLPRDGETQTVKVRFKTTDVGPRNFHFRIPVQPNEEVTQNNQRESLIDVFSRKEKILFVEGEPRYEPKFVRMATLKDENLQLVLLQRTAEATSNDADKYYRLGVDGPDELRVGFPTTRAELFGYRGIILGSMEAAAFTPEQQHMLEDFVDVRGGGLLAIGGARAFSEGGWAGTPLSNALPVALDAGRRNPIYPPFELTVRPTRAGQSHPATQIADTEEAALSKWKELPPLSSVNTLPVSALKPGASLLLSGNDPRGGEQVVLAHQRYGSGKTLILGVQDTWLWRMHAKMAVNDLTHYTFWQRLGRWLVDGVPDRVMVTASPERVQRGEPVTLIATVNDEEYRGINDARVLARVTAPSGKVEDVPMEWTVEEDGEFRARFTPAEDGLYSVAVEGRTKAGVDVGRGAVSVKAAPSDAEYFDAAMRAPLLRRIADETGGRFLRAADTQSLVDAIAYSGRGVTVVEEKELWDMPVVLLMLLGLMATEWLYRRSRGLA
ncbi:MAG: hypothetical protein ABI051_05035 [Vicinamibacterales bacterium]